ncbi:MAG: GxxExxY protein [Chloroflexi bacterium]|nr:GxxExxY protein [Chloroflexota bacterium]
MMALLYEELSYAVIGAAMAVHSVLGPGFLEKVYQKALVHELTLRGIPFEESKRLTVRYKGVVVGEYVADIVADGKIILELKAVKDIHPQHMAQTRNYLTAIGFKLGIVLNFGAASLQRKRAVN